MRGLRPAGFEAIVIVIGGTGPALELELRAGRLRCPTCGGALRPWGMARVRVIRTGTGPGHRVQPQRTRCAICRTTHVLLPYWTLLRRSYAAPLIWQALTAHAAGVGYRRISLRLHVPETTVRDWLRAARRMAPWLLDRLAGPGHSPMSAVLACAQLARQSLAWRRAVLVSRGRLLSNTSPPHATGFDHQNSPFVAAIQAESPLFVGLRPPDGGLRW